MKQSFKPGVGQNVTIYASAAAKDFPVSNFYHPGPFNFILKILFPLMCWVEYYYSETDCYQWKSLCQDPAGNRTTQKPPDHYTETQTAVVWTCLPFVRSGPNHLARCSEKGKKTRQTEEEVEDNITEWTGLEFAKWQREVENREEWRKLVVKPPVVPQRPLRLRNRWRRRDDPVWLSAR